MALTQLGNDIAGAFLGELTGYISEYMTDRIRAHRGELGGPDTGPGSGKQETLTDLALDSLTQVVFLLLGIKLTERAVPAVSKDLSVLILYIIGVSTQTTLPRNLKKLTVALQTQPDRLLIPTTVNASKPVISAV